MNALLIICIVLATNLASGNTNVSSDANREVARQLLPSKVSELNAQQQEVLSKLQENLFHEVVDEIEAEAKAAGKSRDQYIDDENSFKRFVTDLEKKSGEKLKDEDAFLLLIKAGLRLQIQQKVRFVDDEHFDYVRRTQKIAESLSKRLGIVVQSPENQ